MTKVLVAILCVVFLSSCSRNITGTYKHKICSIGPNCFVLTLNKDNSFEYKYFQDVLGRGTIKGKYSLKADTISLVISKDTLEKDSYFNTFISEDSNLSIKVFASVDNIYKESFGGQILLNDSIKLKLDMDGHVSLKKTKVETIKVNLAMNETLRDSIFRINTNDNNIEIYASIIPKMEEWIPKIYLLKSNKIYPLQFQPEEVLLKNNNYYKKE